MSLFEDETGVKLIIIIFIIIRWTKAADRSVQFRTVLVLDNACSSAIPSTTATVNPDSSVTSVGSRWNGMTKFLSHIDTKDQLTEYLSRKMLEHTHSWPQTCVVAWRSQIASTRSDYNFMESTH